MNSASTPPRGLFVGMNWDMLGGGGDEDRACDVNRTVEGDVGESGGNGRFAPMTTGGGDIGIRAGPDVGALGLVAPPAGLMVVVTLTARVGACTSRAAPAVADGVGSNGFEVAV